MDVLTKATVMSRHTHAQQGLLWWMVLGLSTIVLPGLVGLMGAIGSQAVEVADELRARAFVLVDKEGKPRMDLRVAFDDGTNLSLMDREGLTRISLSVVPNRGTYVMLMDPEGRPRAGLSVAADGRPGLSLYDGQANPRVSVRVSPDGTPGLALFNRDGGVLWWAP